MLEVFLVEDEVFIRMMIAHMVEELGHRVVAEAGSIEDARPLAENSQFDLAILDINVAGTNILPIAAILDRRGLPFVFCSGYAKTGLPEPFGRRPNLAKPLQIEELRKAIDLIFSPTPNSK